MIFPVISQESRGLQNKIRELDPYATVGKQYAVFIAINKYQFWTPLKNPVKDAKEIKQILTDKYYIDEVIELYDSDANRTGIYKLFERLIAEVKQEDSVLIFYAGHGHLDTKLTNKGFWIPADGGTSEIDQDRWIPNDNLRGMIDKINSKHILLVSDSCFSGDLLDNKRGMVDPNSNEYFKKAYQKVSRQILTSGASETVSDNSDFAKALKTYLKFNNKPIIDPLNIFDNIRVEAARTSSPMFGYLPGTSHQEGGSFLLFLKPQERDLEAEKKIADNNLVLEIKKIENDLSTANQFDKILAEIEILNKRAVSEDLQNSKKQIEMSKRNVELAKSNFENLVMVKLDAYTKSTYTMEEASFYKGKITEIRNEISATKSSFLNVEKKISELEIKLEAASELKDVVEDANKMKEDVERTAYTKKLTNTRNGLIGGGSAIITLSALTLGSGVGCFIGMNVSYKNYETYYNNYLNATNQINMDFYYEKGRESYQTSEYLKASGIVTMAVGGTTLVVSIILLGVSGRYNYLIKNPDVRDNLRRFNGNIGYADDKFNLSLGIKF